MPSFTDTAIKLYRRLFGTPAQAGQLPDGIETVLDGETAVAITEACIADSAALSNRFPGNSAALAWRSEQQRNGSNMFDGLLHSHDAESARGAVAAATGLAMSGQRTTVFLDGQELAATQDLLHTASGRRLPLVLHLSNRAIASQGGSLGTGHEAYHLSADSGCCTLFATNVQEAVDFTLIARRVAELTLTPVMVVMDGEKTATAGQEVKLPTPAFAREFIGSNDETIPAPNEAQKLLFGESRRRVPRWHDLDNPSLLGALQDSSSFALGSAARAPWFDSEIPALLDEAFAEFARLTGRHYGSLSSENIEKAKLVLIAQGSAVESASAVARYLGKREKLKVGVIGLSSLRPFPGAQLAKLLSGKQAVAVLERHDTPLAGDAPILREVRSALERGLENGRFGADVHAGYPSLREADCPRLHSTIYGIGGMPLHAADLAALVKSLNEPGPSRRYLGIDFHHNDSVHPKRQVMLDTLRRYYPEIEKLGFKGGSETLDLRPDDSLSIAFLRRSGDNSHTLALECGSFLHQLLSGQVRSFPAISWQQWGGTLVDRISHASSGLQYCGDDMPVDALLVTANSLQPGSAKLQSMVEHGVLVIDRADSITSLPTDWQHMVQEKSLQLYAVPAANEGETAAERNERLLGAQFGALLAAELIDINPRKIRTTREQSLSHLGEDERTQLLAVFERALENVTPINLNGETTQPRTVDDSAPIAVRHLGENTSRFDSLPRFWDQVGVLYKNGEATRLTADPYLATGAMPPLSATFNDHSASRTVLPHYEPANCTGCGECWSACPDSAIGVSALAPKGLIETAIALSGATEVRSIAGKLATGIATLSRKGETDARTGAELIADAYNWLQQKAPVAEDRRDAIEAALLRMQQATTELPVAITDPLFHDAEKAQKESGELLSLTINPDSCKGCSLCSEMCGDDALTMQASSADETALARRQWEQWQQTPDTGSATIERLIRDSSISPIAALMLTRHCAFALSGGDAAEAGSGEKIAVRHVLAATEYQQQPLLHRFIQELRSAQSALAEKIRETLADALPTEDLDQLSKNLQKVHTREANLGAFVQGSEGLIEGSGIDAVKMRKLIKLTQGIGDLHWRIAKGEHGLGRARYGLTFAAGSAAAWAGAFPHNPFHAPVTIDMTGNAPQVAAGLLHGQLNEALDAVRLLREARIELDPKADKSLADNVSWNNLTDEERGLIPPLVLIGNDQSLGGEGFTQIAWLLNSELPIKILVLADLDFGLGSQGVQDSALSVQRDARGDLALMALAQRNTYVAQTSFAASEHLRESVRGMLKFPGPALLRVHTPSPERHGFAATATIEQARLAIDSRVLPLFQYDPQAEGVFGSRLSLEGNPEPKRDWLHGDNGKPITPIDWAKREARFRPRLQPLHTEAPAPTELTIWLAQEQARRTGKTPYIDIADELGNEKRLAVDPGLAQLAERLQHAWRTLQELAGLVTPFTARVETEARENIAAEHQAELDALRAEYEEKLRALEEGMHSQMHQQITQRLMGLAGYDS